MCTGPSLPHQKALIRKKLPKLSEPALGVINEPEWDGVEVFELVALGIQ